jgi:site-specific recombinase XerD
MLLDHADLSTTQRYTDMVASDLNAAIAKFGPAGELKTEGV